MNTSTTAADPHAPTSNQRFGPLNSRRSPERIGFNRLLLASHAINMAIIVLMPAVVWVLFASLRLTQWQWVVETLHLYGYDFSKAYQLMYVGATVGVLPHFVHTLFIHGFTKSPNSQPIVWDIKNALLKDSIIPVSICLYCILFVLTGTDRNNGLPLAMMLFILCSFLAGQLLRFKLMKRFLFWNSQKGQHEPTLFTWVKLLYGICTVWTLSWMGYGFYMLMR